MKIFKNYIRPSVLTLLLVFPLILFIAITPSIAQSEEGLEMDLKKGKMKSRAEHAIKTGDIYTALFYYEEIVKKDTQDLSARFELAEVYRLARDYKKAADAYAYVYKRDAVRYTTALYYQGLMQKMKGDYKEAKETLTSFRKNTGNAGDAKFRALLSKEIAGCDSGMTYQDFPENVVIENIGNSVNRPHAEYSPFMLDSTTMLYGSLRMDTLKYFDVRYDHYEPQPVRQIYKAKKVNDKWIEQGKYEVFNDPTMDMGNFVYSPISERYYFSKCSKDELSRVTCKIYYTEKQNGQFIKPVMLPFPVNEDGYTSTQPAIMIDTSSSIAAGPAEKKNPKAVRKPANKPPVKTAQKNPRAALKPAPKANAIEYLYFVSDRPGGKGGLDIWYTYYNSARKQWVKPVNFAVNTPETECTPFYHIASKNFYFSSNGYASAGGLDVFKVQKTDGRYSKPTNMSFPINSPQDELGFILHNDGKTGMLVSNRPGGTPYLHETCCDDIYAFEILPPKPFICNLDLTVVDPDTADCKNLLLKVSARDLKTGKETLSSIKVADCKYQLALDKNTRYTFTVNKIGFQKDTLTVETREMAASQVILKTLFLKPNEKKEIIKPVEGKPFVLNDIQYETNQTELNENAKAAVDSVLVPFMKSNPEHILMISSHTDDQGSHHYNSNLSNKRVENVVKYLESKGIARHRLQGKGFGETQPIAPNQNPDGSDNPIGRGLNRRTEFLVVKPAGK